MIHQMTLRQVPDGVAKGLKFRARKSGQSLNRTIIALIEEALGIKHTGKSKRDLSKFAGQWSAKELAEFKHNTRLFEQLDKEIWKS